MLPVLKCQLIACIYELIDRLFSLVKVWKSLMWHIITFALQHMNNRSRFLDRSIRAMLLYSRNQKSQECIICLDSLTRKWSATVPKCGHTFCAFCILTWACQNRTCPVCRARFQKLILLRPFTRVPPARATTKLLKLIQSRRI